MGNFDVISKATQNIGIDLILESKLNLLHLCLTPDGVPDKVDSILKDSEAAFTTFKNAANDKNDAFDTDYIKALATLRDALLEA